MKHSHAAVMAMGVLVLSLSLALAGSPLWAGQDGREQGHRAKLELPPAVAQAVKANCPNAEIDKVEMEKKAGLAFYDIEFKGEKREIEVAPDGTVMDISTTISLKDVPKGAEEAIERSAAGATLKQVEKSEVRAEVKKIGEKGTIVKLASPKYVYEAELVKDHRRGEIQVAPDGMVVEALKWGRAEAEEKEEAEEEEEANEGKPAAHAVDLEILPAAVLNAFKAEYPKAVIRGASKETEKGVTYYEVESVDGKMNRDLLYTADGKAVEIEETIAPEALPAAVTQALAKAYPGYKIVKAEDMLKNGRKLFEIQIRTKDKKASVTIDPSGKIIGD